MSAHPLIPRPWGTLTCVSLPVYFCKLDQFDGVGMSCQMGTLSKSLRKWNGFGDDAIAEHPSHPCLHVHNAVCHVTPCVLPFSEWRLEQCAITKWLLCFGCQCIHSESLLVHTQTTVLNQFTPLYDRMLSLWLWWLTCISVLVSDFLKVTLCWFPTLNNEITFSRLSSKSMIICLCEYDSMSFI